MTSAGLAPSSADGSIPASPDWFRNALAAPRRRGRTEVDGASIHYLAWGDPERPALVLVHGGAAHAEWWSFLAPLLANRYSVLALDLSGHGESDRRRDYSHEQWAAELLAAHRHAGLRPQPILIGHSMGGLVSIVAASLFGDRLAGAVIVDSPVSRPDPESQEGERGRSFRNPKTYPDLESALSHFRLVPGQPCENGFVLDHIARHSLRRTSEGWSWKFDPRVFLSRRGEALADHLRGARCRVALFRGEYSRVVPPETGDYMYELLGRESPLVEIPEAHHHLMLDQPLAFVAAVRTLLADWEHSLPRRVATAAG